MMSLAQALLGLVDRGLHELVDHRCPLLPIPCAGSSADLLWIVFPTPRRRAR
jgi:hypothetical protein